MSVLKNPFIAKFTTNKLLSFRNHLIYKFEMHPVSQITPNVLLLFKIQNNTQIINTWMQTSNIRCDLKFFLLIRPFSVTLLCLLQWSNLWSYLALPISPTFCPSCLNSRVLSGKSILLHWCLNMIISVHTITVYAFNIYFDFFAEKEC